MPSKHNKLKRPSGVATPSGQAPGMALYKYTHQYKYWWAPASELQVMHHVFIDVAKNKRWLQVKLESGHPSTCFSFYSNRIVFCINPRGCDKHPLTLFLKYIKLNQKTNVDQPRYFMRRIIKAIKEWYRGDDGEPEFNFEFQVYEYKRAPKRHWLAVIISKPIDLFKTILLAIRRNLNTFTTQFFAFLIVVLTAGSFYYQYHINNQKHERCPETQADKKSVNIECRK